MFLDFHTHAFPDTLAHHAVRSLEQLGGIPSYTDGTADGLRRSMKTAGITHSAVCNIVVKPGQTEKVYAFALALLKDSQNTPDSTLVPLASLHPKEPDWKQWLARIKADGFAGIKLHPGYQQFYINDPSLEAFYQEVFAQDLFLMFHAGWDAGFPNPMHASPRRIADVLPVLEQGKTVLAHLGANMRPKEVLSLFAGRNIYFDTAYSMEKIPRSLLREIITAHGPERILFGSDVPWAPQKNYVDYFMNIVAPGFLSKEDTQRIVWSNGANLLHLL